MYPPEPWDLRGQMYLSVFAVPRHALPPLAPAVHPLLVAGRAVVGAAWVRYEPGGTLHYRELLSAVLVRDGRRPRVSITAIWVDSIASRDGGRALWAIPKDLARIDLSPEAGAAEAHADPGADPGGAPAPAIAATTITAGVRVPGRWPAALSIVQSLDGRTIRTRVRGRTALRLGRARWRFDPSGSLGHLAGRRPVLTVALTDFRLRFGGSG